MDLCDLELLPFATSNCSLSEICLQTVLLQSQLDTYPLQELIQVKELLYNPFTPRIVELFSGDGSGRLDFQQFLHMMSVFSSRASAEAKVVWAFALWDFDGKRRIAAGIHPRDATAVSRWSCV